MEEDGTTKPNLLTLILNTMVLIKDQTLAINPLQDRRTFYPIITGLGFVMYKSFCMCPGVLSIIFNVYPIHLTLDYLKDIKSERERKLLFVWLGLICVENMRIVLDPFPVLRIVVYAFALQYANTLTEDNKVLMQLLKIHDDIILSIDEITKDHTE